jgi:hypothetical protein
LVPPTTLLLDNIGKAIACYKREERLREKGREVAIRCKGRIQFQRQQIYEYVAFFTVNALCPALHKEEQGEK